MGIPDPVERGEGRSTPRTGARLYGLYGLYAHALFWATGLAVWLATLLLPWPDARWGFLRRAIRLLATVTGVRVRVHGLQHLPVAGQGCILVANHASYLDSPLLILALPRRISFVAKAELQTNPALRLFLRRIGTEFIERHSARAAARDLRMLSARSRAGRTLLFFPEGTIPDEAALLPFRMGAFLTAVDEGVAVVPVALDGSRALLTTGSWWPRPGRVTLTLGRALYPRDFERDGRRDRREVAQALRDAAREFVQAHCGESTRPAPRRADAASDPD